MKNNILLMCAILFSFQCFASENLDLLPKEMASITKEQYDHKDKCQDLAIISYLSATSHLSKLDKRELAIAVKKIQEQVPDELIQAAIRFGVASHGNNGDGLTKITVAREDALLTSLDVNYLCLINDLL